MEIKLLVEARARPSSGAAGTGLPRTPESSQVPVLANITAPEDGRTPNPTNGIARHLGPYYSGSMQTISLKLPDTLLRQLESEARLRRVTKSHLVRASLEKALRDGKDGARVSCYDLARDLAGKVKGLPKDLATNPAYLKGFGQ